MSKEWKEMTMYRWQVENCNLLYFYGTVYLIIFCSILFIFYHVIWEYTYIYIYENIVVYLSPNLCDFYETFMIHCHLYEGWKYKKLIKLLIIFTKKKWAVGYTGWLVTGKKKKSKIYKFFIWGFVFEKIDFEFSLGTRALYHVSL